MNNVFFGIISLTGKILDTVRYEESAPPTDVDWFYDVYGEEIFVHVYRDQPGSRFFRVEKGTPKGCRKERLCVIVDSVPLPVHTFFRHPPESGGFDSVDTLIAMQVVQRRLAATG